MTLEESFVGDVRRRMNAQGCFPQLAAFVLFFVLLLSSCATKTRIEYRDRIVDNYIIRYVRDTLIDKQSDSVYVEVFTKGDTVYKIKYKEIRRFVDKIVERHDTLWRDSISTEKVEVVREVKKIPKLYSYSMVFSIFIIIFAIIKIAKWLRR